MRGKCESCEFYDSGRGRPHWGECHVRSALEWPDKFENDWCGEHQERGEEHGQELQACMDLINSKLGEPDEEEREFQCRCGETVIVKVFGEQVIDWNGHGSCPGGGVWRLET